MFRDTNELLQHIVQLHVAIPVTVSKVAPFQQDGEQCYRVYFPSNVEPSGEDSYVVSNSCILLYLANRIEAQAKRK